MIPIVAAAIATFKPAPYSRIARSDANTPVMAISLVVYTGS